MSYVFAALCTLNVWLMIRLKYRKAENKVNQYYKEMYDDLLLKIIKMVNRHKDELDKFDTHINKQKLENFIESNKIHDEYVGSMIITYELEQAIKSGILDIRKKD